MEENDQIKILIRRMDLLENMIRDVETALNETRDILEKVINWNQGVFTNDQVDLIRQVIYAMRAGTPEGNFPVDWTFDSYTGGVDELRRRITRLEFLLSEDQKKDERAMVRVESDTEHQDDAFGEMMKRSSRNQTRKERP